MDPTNAVTLFEMHRPHLRAVAHHMLGSTGEADDAVQETWLRLARTDLVSLENPAGWLTTVVSRVCLDMLRHRTKRADRFDLDDPRSLEATGDERPGPEQEAVSADSVSAALLVVLDTLTPPERVAFVLHDVFGISFDHLARTIDRTPEAARKLASRARRKVRLAAPANPSDAKREQRVVEAFLRAAREGDIDGLVSVLAPDVVFDPDQAAAALPDGPGPMQGADAVAAAFAGRAHAARPALIDGTIGVAVAPQGQLLVVIDVTVHDGRITRLDAIADPDSLDELQTTILNT